MPSLPSVLASSRRRPSLLRPLYGANHRLEESLRAKGYDILFSEYIGGHSYANWQGTISGGLIFLLKR